jgi:hypothetical protein
MPTTIDQGFKKFRDNLRITELQESTVSTRQQNVRSAVESDLEVLDSFLVGSYRRGTMIAPLSDADVDVFVVLDKKYYTVDGQASLLDKLKRSLQKTYSKTPEISRNGQAVTIVFSDFRVDVVPSFLREGGGYLIPNSISKRWISTDPKKHIQLWALANKEQQLLLSPLTKMIKAWNREHSQLLRSFHLEVLVLQILSGITISSFPLTAGYVFDQARAQVKYPVLDPAGFGGNIADYLDTQAKIGEVVSRLESAHKRAVEALQSAEDGKVELAYEKWRLIFGSYFPAYSS